MIFDRETQKLISGLRGLPEEDDDHATHRGTKNFTSLVDACIEHYHLDRRTPQETIMEEWSRIVGPEFAKRCQPLRIDASGALILQAGNATVRRELQFMEDRILTAVASLEGCQHIRKIVLRAGQ